VRVSALAPAARAARACACPTRDREAAFTDCDPGAVPPFGMAYGVETAVDDELLARNPDVYVESGDHEQLLHMSRGQFTELMAASAHGHFSRMEH
jgi:Ala-tRNA(Pro) deacylase